MSKAAFVLTRPSYPFGPAALAMLVLALVSGFVLLLNPPPRKTATLTYWTFAKPHYESYQKLIPEFEKEHPGVTVDLQLVSGTGLPQRLQAAFQADLDVPDMVEIEISSAGSFFRGPLNHIGFADLTDRIQRDGLMQKMVPARFAPYTTRGRIFGIPHDVHPVMLAYRRDLFEQLGIKPDDLKTWDDFIRVGKRVTIPQQRYMIEFSDTGTDELEACLFQRGGGYFDPQGNVTFDNDIAVQTIEWYVPLVARGSKTQIANSLGDSYGSIIAQGMENGYFLCLVAPDWRTKSIEENIGPLAGKMAVMPLPAVTPGGLNTSTWGGTMLGITKHCKDQDLAWELAKFLYLGRGGVEERFRKTNILPPVRALWKEPVIQEPRPYWSGEPIGAMYAKLAPHVPSQYTSPFISVAKGKFGQAMVESIQYYERNGDQGFDAFVHQTLKDRADEVRKQIARNPY